MSPKQCALTLPINPHPNSSLLPHPLTLYRLAPNFPPSLYPPLLWFQPWRLHRFSFSVSPLSPPRFPSSFLSLYQLTLISPHPPPLRSPAVIPAPHNPFLHNSFHPCGKLVAPPFSTSSCSLTSVNKKPNQFFPFHVPRIFLPESYIFTTAPHTRSVGDASTKILPLVQNSCSRAPEFCLNLAKFPSLTTSHFSESHPALIARLTSLPNRFCSAGRSVFMMSDVVWKSPPPNIRLAFHHELFRQRVCHPP